MKDKKIKFIILILIIIITIAVFYYFKNDNSIYIGKIEEKQEDILINEENDNSIHIQSEGIVNLYECTDEFMQNYFENSKTIQEDKKEFILIVTSKEKLENNFGASNIIEAPNNQFILQYNNNDEKENAFIELSNNNSIDLVERNSVFYPCESNFETENTYNSWGIEKIGLDKASMELDKRESNDVTVAILDTGCDVDLINQYYPGKIIESYNAINPNEEMNEGDGHGTHIAGTIAEGTPQNIKILPVKVAKWNTFYATDIINGINYISYYNKADVINMSFGGAEDDEGTVSIYYAIEAANRKNIICVAAAGNNHSNKDHFPSGFDNTMSIAACDSNLEKASFSNYGKSITFVAPGVDILSVNGTQSGTSMAAPHVASATAILKSYKKDISLEETINFLKQYAVDLGTEGWDQYFGYGLISLENITYCDCNCDRCSSIVCSACSCEDCIYKSIKNIELTENGIQQLQYNYGTKMNLSNTKIKINYYNGTSETKYLGDFLEECDIIGYDPYLYGIQSIVIKYKGYKLQGELNNRKQDYGWEYEQISDNSIKITKYKNSIYGNNNTIKSVFIPEKIENKKVISLGENVFDNSQIEYFSLPNTLAKIGDRAFQNCSKAKIEIKAKKISVGKYSFKNVLNLQIPLDSEIIAIEEGSFYGCKGLQNIVLSDNITQIPMYCFKECIDLNVIEIPEGVRGIEESAFYKSGLIKVLLPETIEKIGSYAFYGCKISSMEIPEGVTEIGEDAFPYSTITLYLYYNSYAKKYAFENRISYRCLDPYAVYLQMSFKKTEFEPYETVDFWDLNGNGLDIWYELYNRGENNVRSTNWGSPGFFSLNSPIHIKYSGDNDSFRYGDTHVTFITTGSFGETIEYILPVTVHASKTVPTYIVPTNIKAKQYQKLSEVVLPSGFEWDEPDIILEKQGNFTFKARYIPSDTEHYEIVDNIDINVKVSIGKNIIIPQIHINDKVDDGTNNIDKNNIIVTNLNKSEYTITYASINLLQVGNQKATVVIKLTDDKFKTYAFEGGLQEYEFTTNINVITPKKLKEILITKEPNKTTYYYGENFASEGMIIIAKYSDNSENEITNYKILDGNYLTTNQNQVTISYTEEDITKTVMQDILVILRENIGFKDIADNSWYYESVKYVSERGIITGYNDTTFGPFDNLKREQLVNILWRIEGKPDASELPNNFTDVPNGEWYTDAIKWANANGIVRGYGGTTLFGRGDNIYRQDLAIMLTNYAKYKGKYIAPTGTLDKFADKEKVSNYALDAVRWASENSIISGNANEDGTRTIAPLKNAMRCEAAVMLTRFCKNVLNDPV